MDEQFVGIKELNEKYCNYYKNKSSSIPLPSLHNTELLCFKELNVIMDNETISIIVYRVFFSDFLVGYPNFLNFFCGVPVFFFLQFHGVPKR